MLYVDTSAFVKLYADEVRSREVAAAVAEAGATATSLLAYAESPPHFRARDVRPNCRLRRITASSPPSPKIGRTISR